MAQAMQFMTPADVLTSKAPDMYTEAQPIMLSKKWPGGYRKREARGPPRIAKLVAMQANGPPPLTPSPPPLVLSLAAGRSPLRAGPHC